MIVNSIDGIMTIATNGIAKQMKETDAIHLKNAKTIEGNNG